MKSKMEISFVVLHYQDLETTNECVNNICQLKKSTDVNIVIVDNNSPNNSGLELKNTYSNSKNIHVLCNPVNEGFAKGNNLGYSYAKNELQSKIIVVMNNDVMIIQHNFIRGITIIFR